MAIDKIEPIKTTLPIASNNAVTQAPMQNKNLLDGVKNQYNRNAVKDAGVMSKLSETLKSLPFIGKPVAATVSPFLPSDKTIQDTTNLAVDTNQQGLGTAIDNYYVANPTTAIGFQPKIAPIVPELPKGPMGKAAALFKYSSQDINDQNNSLTQNNPNTNYDPNTILQSLLQARQMGGNVDLTNTNNTYNTQQQANNQQSNDLEAQRQALMQKLGIGEDNLNNALFNYKNSGKLSDLLASKFQVTNQASNNKVIQALLGNILQNSIQTNQNTIANKDAAQLGYQNEAANKDAAFQQSLASILPNVQAKATLSQLDNNLEIKKNRDKVATSPQDQITTFKLNAQKKVMDLNKQLLDLDKEDPNYAAKVEGLQNQINTFGQIAGTTTDVGKPHYEKIKEDNDGVISERLVQVNQNKVNGKLVPEVIDLMPKKSALLSSSEIVDRLEKSGASKESIAKAKELYEKSLKK